MKMRLVQVTESLRSVTLTGGTFSKRIVEERKQSILYQCDKCKRLASYSEVTDDWCCTPCRVCGEKREHEKHELRTIWNPWVNSNPLLGPLYGSFGSLGQYQYKQVSASETIANAAKQPKTHVYQPEQRAKK